MKKKYLEPEVEKIRVNVEQSFLSNGQHLDIATYGSRDDDDDDVDNFWN